MTIALGFVILLVAAGLVLIVINGRKLISDWPRLKPVHNVDLAWIQVYFGLALMLVAWFVATDPARVLIEPMPAAKSGDALAAQEQQAKR